MRKRRCGWCGAPITEYTFDTMYGFCSTACRSANYAPLAIVIGLIFSLSGVIGIFATLQAISEITSMSSLLLIIGLPLLVWSIHTSKYGPKRNSKRHLEPDESEGGIELAIEQVVVIRKCPNCGASQVSEESSYCVYCGAFLKTKST
ncbi:MAG: hypothetical protein ACFFCP_07705 [Promethearchaeota archaeon]